MKTRESSRLRRLVEEAKKLAPDEKRKLVEALQEPVPVEKGEWAAPDAREI